MSVMYKSCYFKFLLLLKDVLNWTGQTVPCSLLPLAEFIFLPNLTLHCNEASEIRLKEDDLLNVATNPNEGSDQSK